MWLRTLRAFFLWLNVKTWLKHCGWLWEAKGCQLNMERRLETEAASVHVPKQGPDWNCLYPYPRTLMRRSVLRCRVRFVHTTCSIAPTTSASIIDLALFVYDIEPCINILKQLRLATYQWPLRSDEDVIIFLITPASNLFASLRTFHHTN